MNKDRFRHNNFDLIRLLAAFQVALHHSASHLKIEHGDWLIFKASALFPGVPVFFFISGFLISKSWESNSSIREYAQNRVLRIYPGLIVCVLAATLAVALTGYFGEIDFSAVDLGVWLVSQLSFMQFYNPEFMRAFGVGVLNGSLWTITVELQFYILVPLVYHVIRLGERAGLKYNVSLLLLIAIFLIVNRYYFFLGAAHGESMLYKLSGVSFAPWFYMFLTGVLFQRNFDFLHNYVSGRGLLYLAIYCGFAYLLTSGFDAALGNGINPILFVLLSIAVVSLSFSWISLSNALLRRNDISYGVYIYHMPVVNLLLYMGVSGSVRDLSVALLTTFSMAMLSWKIIEKPSLKLKKHPLNPLNRPERAR